MDASRLAAFPVFADLPAAELDEVAAAVREVDLDAGSTATTLDDQGAAIYFVEQGEADVQSDSGEATQALGPGDTFGEIALLLTGERTATVVARTPMRLLSLSNQDFQRIRPRVLELEGSLRRLGVERAGRQGLTRFVVDCETLLRIAAGEIEVAPEHKLVAPTLVRSQALAALYEAARRGEISAAEGIERVTRINSLKVRFLGDKVLQRTAWKIADQLSWETTSDAEFVALTQLQADAFVTSDSDLAREVSGLVKTATIDSLRTA